MVDWQQVFGISPFAWTELGTALLCGFIIGLERQPAATIWVLAAIGVCIGIGQDLVAIKLSVMVVAVLVGIDILENSSSAMRRGVHRTYNEWLHRANGSLFGRRKEDQIAAAKQDIDDPH